VQVSWQEQVIIFELLWLDSTDEDIRAAGDSLKSDARGHHAQAERCENVLA